MIPRLLRLPRAQLVAAVAPDPLGPVLANLKEAGAIEGYEERGSEIFIWGDLLGIEARLGFTRPEAPRPLDHRGEYFRICRWFLTTPTFRKLSPTHRAIWKLHAEGASFNAIAFKLKVTPMKVRLAIKGGRWAANLPAVTSAMPRGGGGGRPPTPVELKPRCKVDGCGQILGRSGAKGFCGKHYERAKRLVLRQLFREAETPQEAKKTAT